MAETSQTQFWVEQAGQGDLLAASKLLAVYHPILRARAEAGMDAPLRAQTEPDDLLQQTYVEVFRQINRFESRGPDSFLNWILTILDHKLIDAHRAWRQKRHEVARRSAAETGCSSRSYWNLFDQLYEGSPSPSRAARLGEAEGALLACLAQLSEAHRQVLELRFLEGRSVAKVAAQLDKSPGAVVALTKRALEALREAMDGLGDFTRVG